MINLDKYKTFFFDFDGVIADTIDIKTKAFGKLFDKYCIDVGRKAMEYHLRNGGVSRYKKFEYYYKHLLNRKITPAVMRRLDKRYSDLVSKRVISAPFIKGAKELIVRLNRAGKSCFIISGTPQCEIRRIARKKGIDKLFRGIAGSPANKTENLRKIMGRYAILPRDAVYFGDAKSDWEASRRFSIDFVSIVNKKSKELQGVKCLMRVRDLTGLYRHIAAG